MTVGTTPMNTGLITRNQVAIETVNKKAILKWLEVYGIKFYEKGGI